MKAGGGKQYNKKSYSYNNSKQEPKQTTNTKTKEKSVFFLSLYNQNTTEVTQREISVQSPISYVFYLKREEKRNVFYQVKQGL